MTSSPTADNAEDERALRVTRAGRGVLSISVSKLYFILAGYAVQLALPKLLRSPEAFGLYAAAMSVVSILNNVMIAATVQTVSRQISAAPAHLVKPLLRQALVMQAMLGGGLALLLGACAHHIARDLLLDPLLGTPLRIAAAVLFCYAVYAVLVGYLNGRHRFQHQAGLDLSYTTLRTVGILGAAALGLGATGAISGFTSATALIALIALIAVGIGESGQGLTYRAWFSFMSPVVFYHLCLNLTLQVDLTLLKRNVALLALQDGRAPEAAAELASRFAGFYRGAQTFSFVPYQLILSVAFVVFPMISHASSIGDRTTLQQTVRAALRFSLLVLCAIAAPVSGASGGVLRIAYPEVYMAAADSLSVLSIGMAAFALFVIAATLLTSAGRPGLSAGIALTAVVCVVGFNEAGVLATGLTGDVLLTAACATSAGTIVALMLAAIAVRRCLGTFMAWDSALRILFAALLGFAVARLIPHGSPLAALAALAAGAAAYLAALVATRELGPDDLQRVRQLVGARRS